MECTTGPVVTSREDREVQVGNLTEREFLNCQASTTHRKQSN